MATKDARPLNWSTDLTDSLWFQIGNYLTINDIHRLTRTCSRLHALFAGNDFWSYLVRMQFGHAIWHRLIKNAPVLTDKRSIADGATRPCRSKRIYLDLIKRNRIAFSEFDLCSFDSHRTYTTVAESSSLNGRVLYIRDTLELCYALQLDVHFKNILPGKYDVIWRMKLHLPYMLGDTEFCAVAEQTHVGAMACTRWTQTDFSSLYRCFYCDITKTSLWFYQSMGVVDVAGDRPCDVHVSMTNGDAIHPKQGVYLDYVELKLCLE